MQFNRVLQKQIVEQAWILLKTVQWHNF
jgi:hypothetical protein